MKMKEKDIEEDNQRFVDARSKSYKIMAEYGAGVGFLTDLLDYAVLIFGGIFAYMGKINIGDFLAYLLYIKNIYSANKKIDSFRRAISKWNEWL